MNRNNDFLARNIYCILGLPFDAIDLDGSVGRISSAVDLSAPCFSSTPNLNFVIATQSDTAFFNSVVESDLSVADGMPLIWVAKLLGVPIKERVAGSTLFDELSNMPREKKIKVYFFGGQEGVAERAHQKLNETSEGMVCCGFHDPGFVSIDEMSSSAIIEKNNTAKPDFIVVALGAKKGQSWIQKNRDQLNASVISHLGAVINFVAGAIDRAPVVWQRMGLEWLWRIKQEPNLWKRYFMDGTAFIYLLITKVVPLAIYDRTLKRSVCYKKPCAVAWAEPDKRKRTVLLSGSINHQNLKPVKEFLSSIIDSECTELSPSALSLDLFDVEYIDAAFIATLMLFQRYLVEQGRKLELINVPSRILRILNMNNVLGRFHLHNGQ
jgi:N-acetylglucosaminyldiphosphoundecaprenol N-acetyl-beta-D-mannosaminyltransferase